MYRLFSEFFFCCSIILFSSVIFLSFPQGAFAENQVKKWPVNEMAVSADKIWTIQFNNDLNPDDISDGIEVTDAKGNKVNVNIHQEGGKTISIKPPQGGYLPGELYELFISDRLMSAHNQPLIQPVSMKFKVERGEILQFDFNQEVKKLESETVIEEDIDRMVIDNSQLEESIIIGDIIQLPPSEENPLGVVRKIISTTESGTNTIVETETPTFDEVFNDLELYQKVPINANQISNVPEQITIKNVKIPTSTVSTSNFEGKANFKPQPGIKAKWEDGIQVEFNHFETKTKSGLPIYLDGKLIYKKPVVEFDSKVKGKKLQRFNVELVTTSQIQLTASLGVRGQLEGKDIHKDIYNDEFVSTVEIGDVIVPIGTSGLGARMQMGLFLKGDFKGDVFTTVSDKAEMTLGAIAEDGDVRPVFNYEKDLGFSVGGRGEASLKTGGFLNVYLAFANILKGGLENTIGLSADFKTKVGVGVEANPNLNLDEGFDLDGEFDLDPSAACYKFESGSFIESTIVADIELDWINYEKTLLNMLVIEDKKPFDEYTRNTCEELESLLVKKEINLKAGEAQGIDVTGVYYDHYDMLEYRKNLMENDKWPYITLESSDPSIVEVMDLSIKANSKAADGAKATITVKYKEGNIERKAEIPVVIHSDLPSIEKMKQMVGTIGTDITDILLNGREENGDSIQYNFSDIKDDLSELVTDNYMDYLEHYYTNEMCYECDSRLFPFSVEPDVWLEVLTSNSDELVIQTAELGNEMEIGGFVTYTFKKENKVWLLDDYEFAMFGETGLDISVDKAQQVLKKHYLNNESYYDYKKVDIKLSSQTTEEKYDRETGQYYERTYYIFDIRTDVDQFKVKFSTYNGFFLTEELWDFMS